MHCACTPTRKAEPRTRHPIPAALLERLHQVDTPTVCNAIEVAQRRRGFNQFARGTMHHCRPGMPVMVARARIARIAGLGQPTESCDVIKAQRLEYVRGLCQTKLA